jgi:hypothetical protein
VKSADIPFFNSLCDSSRFSELWALVKDAVSLVGFLSVFKEKRWLGFLELKDPGALLELVTVMELDIGIVRGPLDLHL